MSKNIKIFKDPLVDNNPITIQVLGICSALAVTVKMDKAFVMVLALIFVLSISNFVISLIRKYIPSKVRIIVQMTVIASLVTVADLYLKANYYDISKELSVFIGLIITNCIVLGRAEAFAMQNTPLKSLIDGFGNALGYGAILMLVAFFRELFGSGTVFGFQVMPVSYEGNGLMLLPPGAFFVLGLIIWIQRTFTGVEED
tara:strand:- start:122 stop:721 length:600 start_codon:yes stop_codon:yes gene_type:complete